MKTADSAVSLAAGLPSIILHMVTTFSYSALLYSSDHSPLSWPSKLKSFGLVSILEIG
jgi:hypothetical protein